MEILLKTLNDRENLLACTPSIRPATGWVSSKFGYRKSPFSNKKEFHKGMDIASKRGTPICATADGVVSFSGKKGLFGNMIVIDHGHGLRTRYGHIGKIQTKRGQIVKRGETIATVGNTGRSTGPHVHYEVFLNGVQVNPNKYILN
jgi:murein DD-endopeptidase MepM/ murein hydrolase activator NlpD